METIFTIGIDQANHDFGIPAENVNIPSMIQHTDDGCDFHSEAAVLHEFGIDVSEEELQHEAAQQGWYAEGHGTPIDYMGTHLENHGVPVNVTEGNGIDNLISEFAQGHKVIVAVDAGELWHPGYAEQMEDVIYGGVPDHALIVDGISMDTNTITLTDSGTGDFRTEYPLDQFMDAWNDSNNLMVATEMSPEEFLSMNDATESGIGDICDY